VLRSTAAGTRARVVSGGPRGHHSPIMTRLAKTRHATQAVFPSPFHGLYVMLLSSEIETQRLLLIPYESGT
jgi:hypothetical protein